MHRRWIGFILICWLAQIPTVSAYYHVFDAPSLIIMPETNDVSASILPSESVAFAYNQSRWVQIGCNHPMTVTVDCGMDLSSFNLSLYFIAITDIAITIQLNSSDSGSVYNLNNGRTAIDKQTGVAYRYRNTLIMYISANITDFSMIAGFRQVHTDTSLTWMYYNPDSTSYSALETEYENNTWIAESSYHAMFCLMFREDPRITWYGIAILSIGAVIFILILYTKRYPVPQDERVPPSGYSRSATDKPPFSPHAPPQFISNQK